VEGEAARLRLLHKLLENQLLCSFTPVNSVENPCHVASKSGEGHWQAVGVELGPEKIPELFSHCSLVCVRAIVELRDLLVELDELFFLEHAIVIQVV